MSENKNYIAIIDYKMSNIFSVQAACNKVGLNSILTNKLDEIIQAQAVILPGVGAFKEAMKKIKELKIDYALNKFLEKRRLIFGICLGMQLFFDKSYEFGEVKGLGFIKGKVEKFDFENLNNNKIPHLGWNKIDLIKKNNYFDEIQDKSFMYFVHSYFVNPLNKTNIISKTNYGGNHFCSSIEEENIFAVQFHPEKSGIDGIKIYKNIKKKLKID